MAITYRTITEKPSAKNIAHLVEMLDTELADKGFSSRPATEVVEQMAVQHFSEAKEKYSLSCGVYDGRKLVGFVSAESLLFNVPLLSLCAYALLLPRLSNMVDLSCPQFDAMAKLYMSQNEAKLFRERNPYILSLPRDYGIESRKVDAVSSADYAIYGITVDAAYESSEIGMSLENLLETELRDRKVKNVFTISSQQMDYLKSVEDSFEELLNVQGWYANGCDAVLMGKRL